ncbi:hypothetical protein C8R44DRAFT_728167 [Mycena epipterygia]|nr:hypothetical protein C8R44DRAFT_728167 [Mycena epipterygia]
MRPQLLGFMSEDFEKQFPELPVRRIHCKTVTDLAGLGIKVRDFASEVHAAAHSRCEKIAGNSWPLLARTIAAKEDISEMTKIFFWMSCGILNLACLLIFKLYLYGRTYRDSSQPPMSFPPNLAWAAAQRSEGAQDALLHGLSPSRDEEIVDYNS